MSAELTLAESLKRDAGWEIGHFGYNGPNAPYIRIGMKVDILKLTIACCFESWVRDKIFRRSKVTLDEHFRRYQEVSFSAAAFEDAFGQNSLDTDFPFGHWFHFGYVSLDQTLLLSPGSYQPIAVPNRVFAIGSAIRVRRGAAL